MYKNVAFSISELSSSGGTQRILTHLCNLIVDDYKVFILVNKKGKPFFPLDDRVEVINLDNYNRSKMDAIFNLYKVLLEHKIEYYINLDSNSLILYGLLLPKYTRLICWEHFSLESNIKRLFFTLSRNYSCLRSNKFIVLSNYEKESWEKYNPIVKSKLKVIYNPLTINSNFSYIPERQSFKTFLAIGNNIEVKGFDILLEAWELQHSDWALKIIGLSLEDISKLNQVVMNKGLKNVEILGRVNNIYHYYETSSAFILSSRKEATPLVLLESQAFGLPGIVFSHLSSALEIVNDSAIVVDYSQKQIGLARAIDSLVLDNTLYNRLSCNAINNAKRFNDEKFKNAWAEVLT